MSDPPNREARHQGKTRLFNEWIEGANESMGVHTGHRSVPLRVR